MLYEIAFIVTALIGGGGELGGCKHCHASRVNHDEVKRKYSEKKWWAGGDLNSRSTSVFYDNGQIMTPCLQDSKWAQIWSPLPYRTRPRPRCWEAGLGVGLRSFRQFIEGISRVRIYDRCSSRFQFEEILVVLILNKQNAENPYSHWILTNLLQKNDSSYKVVLVVE